MISQERKDELIETEVWLNGVPAVIRDRLLDFPRVISISEAYEYCWETVDRVVMNGGRFTATNDQRNNVTADAIGPESITIEFPASHKGECSGCIEEVPINSGAFVPEWKLYFCSPQCLGGWIDGFDDFPLA